MDPSSNGTPEKSVPALHRAAQADQSTLVLSLLEQGANVEERDERGWTALNAAAFKGHTAVVITLLSAGANIEATTTKHGYRALHTAAESKHVAVVDLLLWKGADITAVTSKGWTVLNCAVYGGSRDVVSSLLQLGVDIGARTTGGGFTALHTAADCGNDRIALLLLEKGADTRAVTKRGWNALHYAANAGRTPVVRVLLEKGADVFSATQKSGYTALHLAAQNAHEPCLRLLSEEGADVLAKAKDGRTALDLLPASRNSCRRFLQELTEQARMRMRKYKTIAEAAAASDLVALRHFLDDNVDINATNAEGWTALLVAIDEGSSATLALLLERGVDVNARTVSAWLPLHLAVDRGQEAMVKTLLDHGADAKAKMVRTNFTALHVAVQSDKPNSVSILLDHGADQSERDERGWTALLWAAQRGYKSVVQVLLARGADVNISTLGKRWTALHLATENNYDAVVRLLLDFRANPLARTKDGQTALDVTPKSETATRTLLVDAIRLAKQVGGGDDKIATRRKREPLATISHGVRSRPGQKVLDRQMPIPIVEPVPISGNTTFDNQKIKPPSGSHVRRATSASAQLASPSNQAEEHGTVEGRRTSNLTPSGPTYRPKSAPVPEETDHNLIMDITLRCGNTSIGAVAVLDSGCNDDWVSARFIERLKLHAWTQDSIIIPTSSGSLPTFGDFTGNNKQPDGMISGSWRMIHHNPQLMYDSTFYINDSPNAPFEVLIGKKTLFGKGILTFSPSVQGALPLIHKPPSLFQKHKMQQGELRTNAEIDRQTTWRQKLEDEEERARVKATNGGSNASKT